MSLRIRDILEKVKKGELEVNVAEKELRLLAVKDIEIALLDVSREVRRGVPEIVFGEGKSADQLYEIVRTFLDEVGRVIVSRVAQGVADTLLLKLKDLGDYEVKYEPKARVFIAKKRGFENVKLIGRVGIVTAGTADLQVAEEAKIILEELGCQTLLIADVGIAGLQRVIMAARRLIEEDVDVVIAVAGMEGALPSVLASILDIPVIGVPTSVGYGFGARGEAALMNMLQSSSLGLTVVNIDIVVAAAIAAYLVLRKINERGKKG